MLPWAMKLRGSPNMGVGLFSKLVIFLLKIRPPHTQLYLCNHAVFCNASLSCSCLCNNSKWCLSSSVSRSSCTVLLLWCFLLHNPMYYIINISGHIFKKKHPLQQLYSKKGRPIYWRLRYATL